MKKQYLSSERLEELKAELNKLKTEKRIEIAERLKRAKELGDLSENSEYFEAREEQGQLETKIAELEDVVRTASIIQKDVKSEIVQIGSTVIASKDGKELKFTIVGSHESKPETGLISNESPIGKAFHHKKAGEEIKVKTPSGEVIYKIIKIE